ncbi:hypothetical protein [Kordiimonas lacus]|uniref:Uncharacterized protein n=1 Tax=Kordiimonas lacus TaxID=637679 RepID=A0A1G7EZ49_9PROT|nr:hypothetical protein [Kordiimonas lacus]SDE68904.1 hypothetical protein SAMN04488071_3547 [Kordiimonas lacus]
MSDTVQIAPRPFWAKLLFALSVIGPLLKDVKMGGDTAVVFFALNMIMLWVLAGFTFGIAGVLAGAYVLVPLVFAWLLGVMLFSGQ